MSFSPDDAAEVPSKKEKKEHKKHKKDKSSKHNSGDDTAMTVDPEGAYRSLYDKGSN